MFRMTRLFWCAATDVVAHEKPRQRVACRTTVTRSRASEWYVVITEPALLPPIMIHGVQFLTCVWWKVLPKVMVPQSLQCNPTRRQWKEVGTRFRVIIKEGCEGVKGCS